MPSLGPKGIVGHWSFPWLMLTVGPKGRAPAPESFQVARFTSSEFKSEAYETFSKTGT